MGSNWYNWYESGYEQDEQQCGIRAGSVSDILKGPLIRLNPTHPIEDDETPVLHTGLAFTVFGSTFS